MNSHELRRSEWYRLQGSVLKDAALVLPPDARIVVVEKDRTIVAGAAVIRYVHVEGVWVAPEHQKGVAFGRLVDEIRDVAHSWQAGALLTGVMTEEWRGIVTHLGGKALPGEHFVFPAEGPRCRG